MKKADPPSVPYLGIVLSEMSALLEGLATRIEDDLINFSKMRRVRFYCYQLNINLAIP